MKWQKTEPPRDPQATLAEPGFDPKVYTATLLVIILKRRNAIFRCRLLFFAFRLDETLIFTKKSSGVDLWPRFLEGSKNDIFLTSKFAFRLDETLIFRKKFKKNVSGSKWFC